LTDRLNIGIMYIYIYQYKESRGFQRGLNLPNVTVYLPDDLFQRFRRRRAGINLSTLLQAALAEELNALDVSSGGETVVVEDEVKALVDEGGLIMRLNREKAQLEARWFKVGVRDGILWTNGVHYAEVRLWGEAQPSDLISVRKGDAVPEVMKDFVDTYWREPDWDYEAFVRGWLAGVKGILKRMKD
jgi:post-segregation antitoxin (ccd killing protein)